MRSVMCFECSASIARSSHLQLALTGVSVVGVGVSRIGVEWRW